MNAGGAYGFALVTNDDGLPDLAPAPEDALPVSVSWTRASSLIDVARVIDDTHYRFGRRGGGLLEVDRRPGAVRMSLPNPTSPAAVVHPLLTLPLALLAHWRGDLTLHGGAFVAGGYAWGLIGEREAGKSSMLTALGRRGHPVTADDLIVIGNGVVRAGPACVDLRADAASRCRDARSIGILGARERFRLAMTPAPAEVPYGGAILLEWHDGEPTIDEVPLEQRLRLVEEQHYAAPLGPPPPEAVLDVLTRPVWRLRRRLDWAAADQVLDQLLGVLAESMVRQ